MCTVMEIKLYGLVTILYKYRKYRSNIKSDKNNNENTIINYNDNVGKCYKIIR